MINGNNKDEVQQAIREAKAVLFELNVFKKDLDYTLNTLKKKIVEKESFLVDLKIQLEKIKQNSK